MLGRHLLYYLPVNAAQAVVGFGSIYVLTRLLSPHDYGLYALALAATHFAHVPVFTWLESAAARFHARAQRRGRLADHFATLFAVWAVAAAGFTLVLALALWLLPLPAEIRTLSGFVGAALIARAAMKLFQESRRAAQDAARYGVLETIYILAGFGIGIGFVLGTPLRAAGPFAGLLVAALVCVLVEAPVMLRRARGGRAQTLRAVSYARYGAPLSLSLVMSLIVSVSDRFMIAGFLGEAAAGVYAAGYALADRTLDILFVWVGMAAAPLAVSLFEREGGESARRALKTQAETMVLISMPAAVGLALVAGPLAAVMTGEAFRDQAAHLIPWVAAAGLLGGFTTYYLDQSFELTRKTHLIPLVLAAPAAANIVLNLALIPVWGVTGAVVATVCAYAAGAITTFIVGSRLFALPLPVGAIVRTAAACAVMAVAVLALPYFGSAWVALLIHAGAGAIAFAAAALLLDAGPSRAFALEALRRVRRLTPPIVEPAR